MHYMATPNQHSVQFMQVSGSDSNEEPELTTVYQGGMKLVGLIQEAMGLSCLGQPEILLREQNHEESPMMLVGRDVGIQGIR